MRAYQLYSVERRRSLNPAIAEFYVAHNADVRRIAVYPNGDEVCSCGSNTDSVCVHKIALRKAHERGNV